jgi:hypothetical protein
MTPHRQLVNTKAALTGLLLVLGGMAGLGAEAVEPRLTIERHLTLAPKAAESAE